MTDEVAMLNVAVLEPAGMLTDAGTLTLELLDERVTCNPPAGAGLERVTVPVSEFPPVTDVVESVKLWRLGTVAPVWPARPILFPWASVNQSAPSGPAAIP